MRAFFNSTCRDAAKVLVGSAIRGTRFKRWRAIVLFGVVITGCGRSHDVQAGESKLRGSNGDAKLRGSKAGVRLLSSQEDTTKGSSQGDTTPDSSQGDVIHAMPANSDADSGQDAPRLTQLEHVIVIYLENHSFDNLYGSYPGVEGLDSETASIPQRDAKSGELYDTLPQLDPNIPLELPNQPFDITRYVPSQQRTIDLVHRFYQEQSQINGGKMDRFVADSDAKGLSFGFYPTTSLGIYEKLQSLGNEVTLCDHFFHAAFGGSFLNHVWLIAAATPKFPGAPASQIVKLDAQQRLVVDGAVTADGDVVNLLYSINTPHPKATPKAELMPNQTMATIGDRLSEKGVSWAWYAGGWDNALAGRPSSTFQFHHQPFVYFQNYADGSEAKAEHLKDEREFIASLSDGTLPAVSFVKPLGSESQHPGYADLTAGDSHLASLIDAVHGSALWSNSAIIVTYDENGGFWDHVPPPLVDKWGPGTRVPTLVISPFAKGGVDKTVYDTTAILKLIEERWGLAPLSERDAAQPSLAGHALDLTP